jgi:hypothetical protein
LPFYYFGWYFFLRLLDTGKNKWLWLTCITLFIGVQFDWLSFFQAVVMSSYLLFTKKEKLPKWMFIFPGAFVLLGITFIIYTYTSWSSVNDYFGFMKWKFSSRTVGQEGHSFLSFWPAKLNIVLFYGISYGILLLCSIISLWKKKHHPLPWLMIITAILHHIVFFGFSSEHDYAALKMAFPIAFAAAVFISEKKKRAAIISSSMIVLFSIIQYFFLHNYSYRKGMYEDESFFVKAGAVLKKQSSHQPVFINTENKYFPQLEFYGDRPYRMATSAEDAKQIMQREHIPTAVFIDMKSAESILISN